MNRGAMISIIVPVYRVENEIVRCVNSLLEQTYRNIEILLIDDGSPDCCPQICNDYAMKHEIVKCYHKENGGLSDARNFGMKRSKGKYILFVDSDDFLELNACERLIDSMENNDVNIVVGALREVHGEKISYQAHSNLSENRIYTAKEFILKSIAANEWYAPAVLNLYKKDYLIQNDLFFIKGRIYEDIEILPRLFLSAGRVAYVNYPFYNYVLRENSLMTSSKDEKRKKSTVLNYSSWKKQFDVLEDEELQRVLYGALLKYYLKSCRSMGIKKWEVPGLDFQFAIKYGLNYKEKIKLLFFSFFPDIYTRV